MLQPKKGHVSLGFLILKIEEVFLGHCSDLGMVIWGRADFRDSVLDSH